MRNLLSFLGWSRKENAHTRMLATLLDPNGLHHEGRHFLDGFLRSVIPKAISGCGEQAMQVHWIAECHKRLPNPTNQRAKRELDLLLLCPSLGIAVVIENKVDAAEGENQLTHYWQWLESVDSDYPKRYLYLLTPEGRDPTSEAGGHGRPIGYKDIADWLAASVTNVKQVETRTIVEQYLHTVRSLVPNCAVGRVRVGRRDVPATEHADASRAFLHKLEQRLNQLRETPSAETSLLRGYRAIFDPNPKKGEEGKYAQVRLVPKSIWDMVSGEDPKNAIVFGVEVTLANRKMKNIYVGLKWTARHVKDPAGVAPSLVRKCERYFPRPNVTDTDGWWIGIHEPLVETGIADDENLIALLKANGPDLQQRAVSALVNHISAFGKEVEKVNRCLLRMD